MNWLRKLLERTPTPARPAADASQAPAAAPPIDAATALHQGNAHVDAGRFDEALTSYRLALANDAGSVAARINIAFVLLGKDGAEEAVPLLVEAIALAPDNADAHFMLGSEYLRQKQIARARECLGRAIELQPGLVWAYPALCQATFELGDASQALRVATEGLRVAPDLPELHHHLGNVHLAQGNFDLAAKAYDEALKRQPHYGAARVGLAKALAGSGRL